MGTITYGSVCSGIEAATAAWKPLGWQAAFVSEIEPFPRAVLAHHYPQTPLHGDFTTIKAGQYGPVDVLVGGTPCQSFSIAGLRGGLADERGNLALEYLRLADRLRPTWTVWENVPGVLSSGRGRDFGSFLGALGQLGYGWAYRVLDAQHFGLAQRRKRVFVVGHLGDWRRAAAVLFEPGSVRGYPAPSRPAREGAAAPAAAGARKRGGLSGGGDAASGVIAPPVANPLGSIKTGGPRLDLDNDTYVALALNAGAGGHRFDPKSETMLPVTHPLRGRSYNAGEDGTGRGTPLVPISFPWQAGGSTRMTCEENVVGTLVKKQTPAVSIALRGREGGNMAEMGGEICPTMRTSSGGSDKLHVLTPTVAHTLRVPSNGAAWRGDGCDNLVAHTLRGEGFDASEDGTGRGTPLVPVCFRLHADTSTAMLGTGDAAAAAQVDVTRTLDTCGGFTAGQGGNLVLDAAPQGLTLHGTHISVQSVATYAETAQCLRARTPGKVEHGSTTLVLGAVPILEAGARTGKASATERAGMGIGRDGDPMYTLQSGKQHAVAFDPMQITSPANRSNPRPDSPCPTLAGKDEAPAVAFIHCNKGRPDGRKSAHTEMVTVKPLVETLTTDCHAQSAVQAADAVRRLTPRECERLQGFPDDYTLIPSGAARKVEADYLRYLQATMPQLTNAEAERLAKDGPRYRALGNSMAVPVMAWIGRRIAAEHARL